VEIGQVNVETGLPIVLWLGTVNFDYHRGAIMGRSIRAFVVGALILVAALIPPFILLMDRLGL
jgi:hypothetical protein